ncbi:MAG: methyltransferase regulatory domain-containing protein, partial [Planctomycetia bacterium]|nr:methyltransferase regulatory domain-containing protein [Planctomycetia bacterium]
ELGCAAGGNLIPMALGLPESSFHGVDLSQRQIDDGRRLIEQLGLKNIALKHQSILDVTAELGKFDYIICHGVFSWVPRPVQDRIMAICQENLADDGIAYISYNTLPGWHMRGMIRDMMYYHASHFREASVRVKQARELLDFLAKSVSKENTPYSLLLKNEVELLRKSRDSYLYHEHLEECNEPIYFHQFAERAAAVGLRYLGEADLHVMVPGNYPPEVAKVLHRLSPDIVHIEQYMDFLRNRMFRQTLLCHQHLTPNYGLRTDQLTGFAIASSAKAVSPQPDIQGPAVEQFRGPGGVTLNSSVPLAKAAMLCLAEVWPRALTFSELRERARARLQPAFQPDAAAVAQDSQTLGQCLLTCYTSASSSLLELHVHPARFIVEVGDKPMVSPLARLQAQAGAVATNLRHETVRLSDFQRQLVMQLDGSRDREALVDALVDVVGRGVLTVREDQTPITEPVRLRSILQAALQHELPRLAGYALLVS